MTSSRSAAERHCDLMRQGFMKRGNTVKKKSVRVFEKQEEKFARMPKPIRDVLSPPSTVSTIPAPPSEKPRELRVVRTATKEVVHRIDVTGRGDAHVTKAMSGMLRNMDTDRFHVEDSADDK